MPHFFHSVAIASAIAVCSAAGVAAEPPAEVTSLRLAIGDLQQSFGARYPRGGEFAARLDELEKSLAAGGRNPAWDTALNTLRSEALLANPLLDFDRLLLIERNANQLGLPQNWEGNSSLPHTGYQNQLAVLSPLRPDGALQTLFRPEGGQFVGDVDLDFDAGRMLFSMPGDNGRWQVFELDAKGGTPTQIPLIREGDVDNYDACYLPDGNLIFSSTAPFTGVPCVTGASHVANLFRLERSTGAIRRLTFDQEHNWCPTVLNDGRILYQRWEYSDIPHFAARILFHMNPDGTDQKEYYGSGSYWPNAMFYARPAPGSPTAFAAVVGGHHGLPRMGELVTFDTSRGRFEADGAVQRIPGRGRKIDPIILDQLTDASWPKYLHPWPLSEKYLLVSAKPTPESKWGIYLADVFDNLVLIRESADNAALLEPVPLKPSQRPRVVPSKVKPGQPDATISILDIYQGPGLDGVPRGTVKQLRVFTYHFAYHGMGGQTNRVGLDGPWDIKRIMGTVPVEPDGSVYFRVPANTPVSIQPLDADGQALQLMRSWLTAMPGETQSCIGCHDQQNSAPPATANLALTKQPAEIQPWHGPERGFSFIREVQPVLDRHCAGCHDGANAPGHAAPDLRPAPPVHPAATDPGYNNSTHFTPSYLALRSFVRGHTIESDLHLLTPCEFSADTTELIQLLRAGHYGVKLDAEAWDRLITWIDLNTPAHGTWTEIVGAERVNHQRDRRREMLNRYAQLDSDPEAILNPQTTPGAFQAPAAASNSPTPPAPQVDGWPFDAAEAKRRQAAAGPDSRKIDLGDGVSLDLVRIPAGSFAGFGSGKDPTRIDVAEPFWIGRCEVTNRQFARFSPNHDSRIERGDFLQFSVAERGIPANAPDQPVVRVSWTEADAFCRWLAAKTGEPCSLPDEARWEYACRAGTATPLWYGATEMDFTKSANLADRSLRTMPTLGWGLPSAAVPPWRPAVESLDDHFRVAAPVGSFAPNAWGLHDMAGNVWEWTTGEFAPDRKAVRGGSWSDRPFRATSASRQGFRPWQRVYHTGFRLMIGAPEKSVASGK